MTSSKPATSTPRTGRRQGPNATRDAILAAAREAFAAQGYTGTSLREVARRAGGFRFEIQMLLTAEMVGTAYYELVKEGCGDPVINACCRRRREDRARDACRDR